jgi:DedD protein
VLDASRERAPAGIERATRSMSLPLSVVFAAAVGSAFGLGIIAGGSGAAHASAPAVSERDPLGKAEARTAAYEALVKASTSTWHAELTTPEPTAAPPLPRPAAVATTSATSDAADAPATPPASPEVVQAIKEAVAQEVVAVAATKTASTAGTAPAARDHHEDRVDEEGDVDRSAQPDPLRLNNALQKVLGDKAPVASEDRHYALQLASTGTAAGARGIADGFKARGFAPEVVSADVPGRGTVYRVRLGGLATRAAAESMKARVGQGLVVSE